MGITIPPHIFREYDVRGLVDSELSEPFARLLGRAFARMCAQADITDIAVGFDARLQSAAYADCVIDGIVSEGVPAVAIGIGPTPMAYFALCADGLFRGHPQRRCGAAVQITGSHNPSNMNGFKLCIGLNALPGSEIQRLRAIMFELADQEPACSRECSKATIWKLPLLDPYTEMLIANSCAKMGPRKLKIVCDAGNGVGGLVGPRALRALGHEVIELFCEPDGHFPNHHPDPTVPENVIQLAARVRESSADFGIGWDGDADRIGVVDQQGNLISGDMLTLLFGRDILKEVPGATIIGDIKCSAALFEDLRSRGANAVIWKSGHSHGKAKLKELHAQLAGELSGHICFGNRYFGFDDGLYASLRLAEIVSHTQVPFSHLLQEVPAYVATPELRVDCSEQMKFRIAEEAKRAFPEYSVLTIDGARVSFPHGWALIRASNTQPLLVLRFEAVNQQYLEQYRALVMDRLEAIKSALGAA